MKSFSAYESLIKALLLVLLFFLCCQTSFASAESVESNLRIIRLLLIADSSSYQLPDSCLVTNSERIENGTQILQRGVDYTIDYGKGIITFLNLSELEPSLTITYCVIPNFLRQKLLIYEQQSIKDSLQAMQMPLKRRTVFTPEENLKITGSKTFSLTFSNQESYDLKQSLYLQLNGEISNNMQIEGRLSDSQSQLTPEGDTREISSLDQVYLKLYGRQYSILLGDQDFQFDDTSLMQYRTKFEGINLAYSDKFGLQAAAAVNGGKNQINIIPGIEGKQGPYYLTANVTGQTVQVVPGSEKISVNGVLQNRGSDYVIDYAEGSITFKKLITADSRIVADFQYTDEYYTQNLFLNSSFINFSPNLKLTHHFIYQADDKSNPLQWTFSSADKDSLRRAGDATVWGQGAFPDSTGQYVQETDPSGNQYYRYVGNYEGDYNVYFTYVGPGYGSYEPIGTDKYKYMGAGLGSWIPYRKLIAPVTKTNLGLNLLYGKDNLNAQLEGVYTYKDNNTFSSLDDDDNSSLVTLADINLRLKELKFQPSLDISYLHKEKNSFLFSNIIPANEYYEFSSVPTLDSLAQDKLDLTLGFENEPVWREELSARYKQVRGHYTQKYIKTDSRLSQIGLIPSFNWYGIFSQTAMGDTLLNTNYHLWQNAWQHKILTFSNDLFWQKNDTEIQKTDSLSGTQYLKINPAVKLSDNSSYESVLSYANDANSARTNKDWRQNSSSQVWQFTQMLNKFNNTLNFNIAHRETEDKLSETDSAKNKNSYDIIDFKSSHQLWNNSIFVGTAYQLNQLEYIPKIKELEYVGDGLGAYDSTGVLTENGDYEYSYVNSGTGELSAEINANLNLGFHLAPNYFPASILHRFNLDSDFQLTNNTTEKGDWELYLLLPHDIMHSDSTKYGRIFMRHTLWIDVWKKVVTANLRYESADVRDARYQDYSKIYEEERELELEWKKVLGGQLRTSLLYTLERDSKYSSDISSDEFIATYFRSVNPALSTQLTASYALEDGKKSNADDTYKLHSYKFNPQLTWFFRQKYRATANLLTQYNQRSGSNWMLFAREKRQGFILDYALTLQCKFSSFTSGSVQYSGKSYPHETMTHELKMEFRAEL